MESLLPTIFLPVLSGYLFLLLCLPTRYLFLRLNTQHLTFVLIISAVFLFGFSMLVKPIFSAISTFLNQSSYECLFVWFFYAPFFLIEKAHDFILATMLGLNFETLKECKDGICREGNRALLENSSFCFVLSITIGGLALITELLILSKNGRRKFFDKYFAHKFGGRMASLLTDSSYDITPVLITLKSKKVYVGYIRYLPLWGAENKAISLNPIMSGYREEKNNLTLNNDYEFLSKLEALLGSPEADHHKNDKIRIYDKAGTNSEITQERARQIIESAFVTFRYEDIDTLTQWIPELYFMQHEEDVPLTHS